MIDKFYETNSKSDILEGFFALNIDLLCIIDINENFIKVNDAWKSILGYSSEELALKKFLDFVHPMDLDATRFAMGKLINQNDNLSFVNRYRAKNDAYRYIEWCSRLQGEFIYVSARDVTEKKLNDAALIKAIDQAEIANTAKSQFLANVSHEIRTPMNGISGFLQLLENTQLTSEQVLFVNNMKFSATLLNNVINDIIDMSKMEMKEIELEVIPFNLFATVEDAVMPHVVSAYNKKLSVDLFIQPDTPEYVMGDPTRLRQIISNLLSNAVKFTEQGGIIVEVSLEESFKHVYKLLFRIKDNGIGISKDVVNHLFEPFVQNDSSSTRKYGGTGLGLTITKNLVEAMQGRISVESEEGKGSEISFTVLLMMDNNQRDEEKVAYPILNSRSMMIVDDNPEESKRLRHYLEAEGAIVATASSGTQAILELMKSGDRFDVILISQDLSDIKADDLLVALSVMSTTKNTPLILMTSKISYDSENSQGKNKFTTKINKPIRKKQVLLTLSGIVSTKENGWQTDHQGELEMANQTFQDNNEQNSLVAEAHEGCNTEKITSEPRDESEGAKKRQCVLIVDDSLMNTKLLETALSEDYDTLIANCGKDALTIANSKNPPDLILLDIMMPEMNGYEVCKKLHQEHKTKDIPVIFLTALSEADNVEYGLKLGAIDYITKPFSITIVKAKIKNHLALKYYQDILKINTDVDQLTQIPNRRRFDEMLSIETRKAKRMGSYLSVLMIDIDHFKLYNDAYGHLEGDECLRQVAFALKISLKRPGDLAARWGGEEFVCLLPDTDSQGAAKIGEKVRKAIMDLGIPHRSSPVEKVVTISVGVVTSNRLDNNGYDNLLKYADEALYRAKATGRNRISLWENPNG